MMNFVEKPQMDADETQMGMGGFEWSFLWVWRSSCVRVQLNHFSDFSSAFHPRPSEACFS
jgi:hypothetical protein